MNFQNDFHIALFNKCDINVEAGVFIKTRLYKKMSSEALLYITHFFKYH